MQDSIFREYDIRGRVGSEFDLSQVYALGKAIAYYFMHQYKNPVKTVALGMDGRIHSPFIKDEITRAFLDSGLHIVFVGVCPTPVLYFALHTLPVDAGLMITASHNGKEYNGIKICLGKEAIWGSEIEKIKHIYHECKHQNTLFGGSYKEYPIVERYIQWLVGQFKHLKDSSLPAVLDCGNGATGVVIPQLVAQLGLQDIEIINAEIDGNFPNHEPDPAVIENMSVLKSKAVAGKQVGIGFDGDGDRMVPITQQGNLILGDKLVALFAQDIASKRCATSVVFDVKCSAALMPLLASWKAHGYMVPSGHSIIKYHMKKRQALLGGELSCHFFFADRYFGYDDGIYAALRLYELMLEKHETDLDRMLEFFPHSVSTPEIRIAYAESCKDHVMHHAQRYFEQKPGAEISTVDGVRATLPYGWGLVRFSNTQPVLSLRFEAATHEGLKQIQQDFAGALKDHVEVKQLEA